MMRKKSFVIAGLIFVLLLAASMGWAAQYTIKLAHNLPPTSESLYHQAALKFKEQVEKAAQGKVVVQIFPSAQLGSDVSVAKKVQSGAVEMEIITANKLGSFYPGIDLYSLPFLLNDFDLAATVFKASIHQKVSEELEKKTGLKSLAFVAAGFRNITNSKHPINKPADIKDLKIRVPKNKIEIATFKALGGNPVNIPGSELYSALQQGVADGQDGSAAWAYAKKVYEVQKYLAVTHHQLSTSTMIINARYFYELPRDIQQAITQAAAETREYWQELSKNADQDIIEKFKAKGMKITYPDLKPFIEAVQPVYKEFAQRVGGMDRIKAVQAIK
ncbi:MAG: TRAP transporter substrate-binding protein [Deltaproteobacteria bacterium]|nr:TRAP transporter substrate-binding protein [Deltaproteobacteria bacterium]